MLRRWIRNNFGFSSGETNGVLVLIPLMIIAIFSEPVYRWWSIRHEAPFESNQKSLDSIVAIWDVAKATDSIRVETPLFRFDPNSISEEDFIHLGFTAKTANRIIRYRNKGGKFRVKNDLFKIYGLDSLQAKKIEPWIDLPTDFERKTRKNTDALSTRQQNNQQQREKFDLNVADSLKLTTVYGIGPKLSIRILKYRNRLGGFVSMDQLPEVYGLDSAVILQLKKHAFIAPDFRPRQVDLNEADAKTLTTIPYIKFNLANAITTWRFQHGNFKNLEELRQIVLLDDVIFQKIKPYLTVKQF